jgi:polyisoprenyl-phosphate glycosyltransferase
MASESISIVVPVFNERGNLRELCDRLIAVLEGETAEFELLFVDDGSSDGSLDLLLELQKADSRIRILELSRNFGHQMALAAGLERASGDAVVMMDSDLQHPPELIPEMAAKWREGYEIVSAIRQETMGVGLWKNLTSRFFYFFFRQLSDVQVPPGSAEFRFLDRRVVDSLKEMPERALFLRGMVHWVGFRHAELSYNAGPRTKESAKYSALRMARLALDGITSFSSLPLYLAAFAGCVLSSIGFLYALYALYARLFTDRVVEGWASVLIAVLVLGGGQLIALGVIGAYLARIYDEVKRRPRYLVRREHAVRR